MNISSMTGFARTDGRRRPDVDSARSVNGRGLDIARLPPGNEALEIPARDAIANASHAATLRWH
jgi:uncharacterized protein YicC (UPF0701 family)